MFVCLFKNKITFIQIQQGSQKVPDWCSWPSGCSITIFGSYTNVGRRIKWTVFVLCPPRSTRSKGTMEHLSKCSVSVGRHLLSCSGSTQRLHLGGGPLTSAPSTKRRVNTVGKFPPYVQAKPWSSKAFDLFSRRWKKW